MSVTDVVSKIMVDALEKRGDQVIVQMERVEDDEKLLMTFLVNGNAHVSVWLYKDNVETVINQLREHFGQMK